MYNTSAAYKLAIENKLVRSRLSIAFTLTDGTTFTIGDDKIIPGSVSASNKSSKNNNFALGSAYVGEFDVTLLNVDESISRYSLFGAEVVPTYYQVLLGNTEEAIPIGKFYVSEAKRSKKTIALECYDAMTLFDVPQLVDTFGTAYELLDMICSVCGVPLGMTQEEVEAMPNGTVQLTMSAERVTKCRDAISYISTVLCGFATINRSGELVVRQNGDSAATTIGKHRRTASTIADYQTYFIGIKARMIQAGNWMKVTANVSGRTSGIVLDLGDLPVVQGVNETLQAVAQTIANNLGEIVFTPAEINMTGDPSLDLGDIVELSDVNNTTDDVEMPITSFVWKYHGTMKIAGEGGNALLTGVDDYQTKQIASIEQDMAVNEYAMKQFTNAEQYGISSTDVTIITLNYSVNKDTVSAFICTIPVYMSKDGEAIFGYHLNTDPAEEVKVYLERGWHAVTLTNYFANEAQSQNRLTVTCRTAYFESDKRIMDSQIAGLIDAVTSGEYEPAEIDTTIPGATIPATSIKAILFASGINTSESWDGTLLIIEEIGAVALGASGITVKPISETGISVATSQNALPESVVEQISAITLGSSSITVKQIAEAVVMGRKVLYLTIDTSHDIDYTYSRRLITIVNDAYTLNQSYPSPSEYETIDSGALKKSECNVTGTTPSAMVISVAGEQGGGGSSLPSAYQEVEYIENTTTSKIATDFKPTYQSRIVIDAQEVTSNTYPRIFQNGAYNSQGAVVMGYESNQNLYIKVCADASYYASNIARDYVRHVYEIDRNVAKIDGTSVYTSSSTSTPSSTAGIVLFGRSGSTEMFKGKIYSAKMYENDVLSVNLVPCYRKSDSVIGMYDTVNDVFYTNIGGGTFSKGADVSGVTYKTLVTDGTDVYSISSGAITASVGLLANLSASMFQTYGFDALSDCVDAESDLFALGEFAILRWCSDENENTSTMLVTITAVPDSQDILTPVFYINNSHVTGIELTITDSDGSPKVALKFDSGNWEYYDFTDEMWEEVGTGTIGYMTVSDLEDLTEEIWAEKFATAATMQTKLTLPTVNDTIALVQYKFLQEEE